MAIAAIEREETDEIYFFILRIELPEIKFITQDKCFVTNGNIFLFIINYN